MKKTLFVTGASGFIGGNFIERIESDKFDTIFCLSRKGNGTDKSLSESANIKFIKGDIFDTHRYSQYLENVDTVIHFRAIHIPLPFIAFFLFFLKNYFICSCLLIQGNYPYFVLIARAGTICC